MLKNQIVLFVSSDNPGRSWQCLAQEWQWELIHHDQMLDALGACVVLFPSIIVLDLTSAVGQETFHHVNSILLDAPQSPLIVITLTVTSRAISIQNHIWRIDLLYACQSHEFIVQQLTQAADMAAKSATYKPFHLIS